MDRVNRAWKTPKVGATKSAAEVIAQYRQRRLSESRLVSAAKRRPTAAPVGITALALRPAASLRPSTTQFHIVPRSSNELSKWSAPKSSALANWAATSGGGGNRKKVLVGAGLVLGAAAAYGAYRGLKKKKDDVAVLQGKRGGRYRLKNGKKVYVR